MSATVISLRTRLALPAVTETLTIWWSEPAWCPGDCQGGETLRWPDGGTVIADRAHERSLLTFTAADDTTREAVTVAVVIDRFDSPGEPTAGGVVLRFGDAGVRLTRQQRIDLANALLAANDLDDAAEAA